MFGARRVKMDRDTVEIMRILEDADDFVSALYEGAEWCYREKKETHESERFIAALKARWKEIHGE
jgi:hypothetical protein